MTRIITGLLCTLIVLTGCKSRRDGSAAKDVEITDGQSFETIYAAIKPDRDPVTQTKKEFRGSDFLPVDPKDQGAGKVNHVCWQKCNPVQVTDETPIENPNNLAQHRAGVKCEVTGMANAEQLIVAGGKLSPTAQTIITNIFVDGADKIDSKDAQAQNALAEIRPLFSKPDANVCAPKQGESGFGLGTLYHTKIIVANRSQYPLSVEGAAYVLVGDPNDPESSRISRNSTFVEVSGLQWDVRAKTNTTLYVDTGNIFGGITYKVKNSDGVVITQNGSGVAFNSPQVRGIYVIDISDDDVIAATGGGEGGGGSGKKSKVDICVKMLTELYDYYPKPGAQYQQAPRDEMSACHQAAASTDWNPVMKTYYCIHPGVPIRQCFTYGAAALKKAGYSQQAAYAAMYSTCITNGSFNSMNRNMRENFKIVMLDRWTSGDDATCIDKFRDHL